MAIMMRILVNFAIQDYRLNGQIKE